MIPIVNSATCSACGNCASICPNEIYRMESDASKPAHPEDCIECWACVHQCPTGSIQLREQ